jgi:hypothetical protein
MPDKNFIAFDKPVAPARSPLTNLAIQRSANTSFGLCSKYSMKVRWPQNTNAAVSEYSAIVGNRIDRIAHIAAAATVRLRHADREQPCIRQLRQ